MVVWRFTSDEVVHFIMDILGDGDESGEENMLGEEGDAEVDPEDDSGSDGDYPEESVKEVNKPSISRGWGRGRGRNMRRGGCGCGRGRRQQAQGAAEQQACGNIDTCTQRLSGYNRQHGPTQLPGLNSPCVDFFNLLFSHEAFLSHCWLIRSIFMHTRGERNGTMTPQWRR